MENRVLQIGTETAYDALESAYQAVVRLCERPRTLEEIAAAEGTKDLAAVQKKLDRLVRNGVLRRNEARYESVASVVHLPRLEGMITFVSRFVLPNLMRLTRGGEGFAATLDLAVPGDAQRQLRQGFIAELARDLNDISDEPASEEKQVFTLVAMGTSDVPPADEMENRLIDMVRRTSRQRLIPSEADRAFYMHFDTSLAPSAVERAEARVRAAAQELGGRFAANGTPNYTVALGFSRRYEDGGVK